MNFCPSVMLVELRLAECANRGDAIVGMFYGWSYDAEYFGRVNFRPHDNPPVRVLGLKSPYDPLYIHIAHWFTSLDTFSVDLGFGRAGNVIKKLCDFRVGKG